MRSKPVVGQVVKLNACGRETIHGVRSDDEFEQSQRMTITYVSEKPVAQTGERKIWQIHVDQPAINRYLIDNECVDLL